MYIILDQAGNVTDTQYCFIRSSLTWDDGKVFLLTRFLHLFSGLVLFKIILRLCSANKYLITNNITNANIQCNFLELIRYIIHFIPRRTFEHTKHINIISYIR